MEVKNVVEMKGITMKFGDFTANDNIDLDIRHGEVHALLGENGAGKSTIMNCLYGFYTPTYGEIFIKGKKVEIKNPNVAIQNGIGMVHQHFMLVNPFTVTENIILGMEKTKDFLGTLDMKQSEEDVAKLSAKYGFKVEPNAKIQDITVGTQQKVEILKILFRGADILIFDEPTAVLTPQEIDELMKVMRNLTKEGKTIILITHKLKEIKASSDRCTIIRRGKKIGTVEVKDCTEQDLASMMVGRAVSFEVEKKKKSFGKPIFEIKDLVVKDNRGIDAVEGLSLEVREGEILGIAGIDGNGQSELLEAITGLRKAESGSIKIAGKEILNQTPTKIMENRVFNIPEDRQKRGLVTKFPINENMILGEHNKKPFTKGVLLDRPVISDYTNKLMEKFDVRPLDEFKLAGDLSGGNQQKVILAREINKNPVLLLAAQPTRGLDVGAIEFIHKSIVEQRDSGKTVLLISFELDEVMNLSDRIAVIYEGQITAVVDADKTNENQLGLLMAGGSL